MPSALILDIWLQGSELDGLGIEMVKKKYPHIPVIMISTEILKLRFQQSRWVLMILSKNPLKKIGYC